MQSEIEPQQAPLEIKPTTDWHQELLKFEAQRKNPIAPEPSVKGRRIDAIDFARGIAVTLMILSHGVKGLLPFEQFPSWGLVPIHLVTKFSATLFILVFGISLAVAYMPHVETDAWPLKRMKLLIRGLKVLFWYKVLTIVEMSHLHSEQEILNALLYKAFPVYVEILGYYAIALLWIPFALPLWKVTPRWLQFILPVVLAFLSSYLYDNFGFWESDILKALLVEHENHYTWGQLARLPLVMVGLLVGDLMVRSLNAPQRRWVPIAVFAALSTGFFTLFYFVAQPDLNSALVAIAKNAGKHPPESQFMFFSLGGAFLLLSICVWGGRALAQALAPITTIGRDALQAFIFHIFVLFVFYRYLFNYWHSIPYNQALLLTGILIVMTAIWVKVAGWVQKHA